MKIIVLGANGMIGSAVFYILSSKKEWDVFGLVRNKKGIPKDTKLNVKKINSLMDIYNVINKLNPHVVINAIGVTKHLSDINDKTSSIYINSYFPNKLADYCKLNNIRLIHISTDCVFSGLKGNYNEYDISDANDFYGKTKSLGEINNRESLTLRTSTIGHELFSQNGLLEWFLSQKKSCQGFSNAQFSGLTNVEFALVIKNYVLTKPSLSGLYNVGGATINKYMLLQIISEVYKTRINIIKDDNFVINRSLNSKKFYTDTGYIAPSWKVLINEMYKYKYLWNNKHV
jgi:dTDP-4-dehydrorhamnose reductase